MLRQIILFIILITNCIIIHCYNRPPQINSTTSEIIIESQSNFSILCQGDEPLFWQIPQIPDDYSNWSKINDITTTPIDGSYKYAKLLTIVNISYVYTGYYNCHYDQRRSKKKSKISSKFYLYVRDDQHLSVSDSPLETLIVTQYSDVTLPCRPTSPDVTVELTLITGEKPHKIFLDIMNEQGILYRYHPHFGFLTNDTEQSETILFQCNFIKGLHTFNTTIIMEVDPVLDSLAKPLIEEVSGGHTVVGQQLILECKIRAHTAHILIDWIIPSGKPNSNRVFIAPMKWDINESGLISQQLIINNTNLSDMGTYICNASDNQNHTNSNSIYVKIYNIGEHFIKISEENGLYTLSELAGAPSIQWRIDVEGHPEPKLTWLNNQQEIIPLGGGSYKYVINFTINEAFLMIKDITISDYGNYTLIAENEYEKTSLSLFLNVTDKPTVFIESQLFHMINTISMIKCIVVAQPQPNIMWWFKPCLNSNCHYQPLKEVKNEKNGFQYISYINLTISQSGFIKCFASNSLGEDIVTQSLFVTDVNNGLDIFGYPSNVILNENSNEIILAKGETLTLTCGASIYNYTNNINWIYDSPNKDDSIEQSQTPFSYRTSLILRDLKFENKGVYSCKIIAKNNEIIYKNISIIVLNPVPPVINSTNLKKTILMDLPKRLELFCDVWGLPKPTVTWFKNGEMLHSNERISFEPVKNRINFHYTDIKDEGVYVCKASNKYGTLFRQGSLLFKNKPEVFNTALIIIIVILTLIVLISLIIIIIKIRKERKLQRDLQMVGLANFEKGALENLNPDLGIDDQAELLPYDRKFEFPIEKLKLGKQLGSGAYGVVMKGEAKGIISGEHTTIVAVKMVKKNTDHNSIKALASELKIMVHLGKHLNVVNLLGACTKHVVKKELLVIVEYCRYGNLHNYLLRHRKSFINQIDPKLGVIDYNIGLDILQRTDSVSSKKSNCQSPNMKYAAISFSNSNSDSSSTTREINDYRKNNFSISKDTDITTLSLSNNLNSGHDNEGIVLSNNSSSQPDWRSNYKGDYKGNVKPICSNDLITWAFQVSRGMEYLASRKVLHGDLAARNILLADDNIVKICDFGLAKNMYKDDNYKKSGEVLLPFKWMAIESIRDGIFSTQSDVWSFGIVLWEFFSLARTPYPGIEGNHRLYNKLLDGYRMECPEYASKEIYDMMVDCWKSEPLSRPSFTQLAQKIGSMLEDIVRKHYIDLNDPYLIMNTQRLENGENDYLAMVSPPNFENLSSPQYCNNDEIINNIQLQELNSGYLCMKPTNIFSPRAEDNDNDNVFDFNLSNNSKKTDHNYINGELRPMLNSTTSDSDVTESFANPSYHLINKNNINNNSNILKTSDNYVNMPQNKNNSNSITKDKNQFVKIEQNNDVHYVNTDNRLCGKVSV